MSQSKFSEFDLMCWRIVRDSEGYSSATQVMVHLEGKHSPHVVGGALKRLFTAGHLRQRKTQDVCKYGFTTSCIPPDGEGGNPNDPAKAALKPRNEGIPMSTTYDSNSLQNACRSLKLTDAQMAQQCDLARRMLQMAALGTPSVESSDPQAPQLLQMHALITAYQALAMATPGVTSTAALLALDAALNLRDEADRQTATAH